MRWVVLTFLSLFFVTGCAHKIPVVTLESTIHQAALAAQRAAGNASDKVTIEVSVTNGFKGSATVPVPVVPIGVETSLAQTIKLTIDVRLKDYTPSKALSVEPTAYFLDLKSGILTEQKDR